MLPPSSFWEALLKYLTIRYLPYQTPKTRPPKGEPFQVQTGHYPAIFKWLKEHRLGINNIGWFKRWGTISWTTGSSNWPTFTGVDEYIVESKWYKGGRGIKVGDVVSARNPVVKDPTQQGAWVIKRVVGLAGHTATRKVGHLGSSQVNVRCSPRSAGVV